MRREERFEKVISAYASMRAAEQVYERLVKSYFKVGMVVEYQHGCGCDRHRPNFRSGKIERIYGKYLFLRLPDDTEISIPAVRVHGVSKAETVNGEPI